MRVCSRFVVAPAEPRAARPPHRVDLVDEDDGRRAGLGLIEELAHAGGADADEELDELRAVDEEERRLGLARDRPRKQRLARARRAHEQHAPGQLASEEAEPVRLAEELDDLLEVALGVAQPRHVGEANADVLLPLEAARAALEDPLERAEPHGRAGRPAREPHPSAEDQHPRDDGEQDGPPQRDVLGADGDGDVLGAEGGHQLGVGLRGHGGGECRHGLAVDVRVRLQLSGDALTVDVDPLDVPLLHEGEESRVVDDRPLGARPRAESQREQQSEHRDGQRPPHPGCSAARRLPLFAARSRCRHRDNQCIESAALTRGSRHPGARP